MGSNLNTFHLVSAPPAVPYRFGLFSVATPRTGDLGATGLDEHWRLGVTWQSQSCGSVKVTTGPCIDPEVNDLIPDGLCSVLEYEPFTVYAYNDDAVPGHTLTEHEQNARDRLLAGEQVAVEGQFWSQMGAELGAAVDLSGAPAYVGLGFVEQSLAQDYGSMGVIHVSRLGAIALGDHLVADGQTMRTRLGTTVVVGGGYDEIDLQNPTSTFSIYGTGPVVLYRGDVDVRQAAIDKSRNQVSYIAQRDYVVGWDCEIVGVTASLCDACEPTAGGAG